MLYSSFFVRPQYPGRGLFRIIGFAAGEISNSARNFALRRGVRPSALIARPPLFTSDDAAFTPASDTPGAPLSRRPRARVNYRALDRKERGARKGEVHSKSE